MRIARTSFDSPTLSNVGFWTATVSQKRWSLKPSTMTFNRSDSCSVRLVSVVPPQALLLMNDEFVEDQAGYLAARAVSEAVDDLQRIIERMFELTVSRVPNSDRLREVIKFVKLRNTRSNRTAALTDLAHVLFNSSEFLYVE